MKLSEWCKKHRTSRGWKRPQAAVATGLSVSTIKKIESGDRDDGSADETTLARLRITFGPLPWESENAREGDDTPTGLAADQPDPEEMIRFVKAAADMLGPGNPDLVMMYQFARDSVRRLTHTPDIDTRGRREN